jgi:hypothetical protein
MMREVAGYLTLPFGFRASDAPLGRNVQIADTDGAELTTSTSSAFSSNCALNFPQRRSGQRLVQVKCDGFSSLWLTRQWFARGRHVSHSDWNSDHRAAHERLC